MKKVLCLIFALINSVNMWSQIGPRSGKDYALFIATTEYKNWIPLPGIDSEVQQIANELTDHYTFDKRDVAVVINPDRKKFLDTLESYTKRQYNSEDQLLVYISGHGWANESMGALIPKDGKETESGGYDSWITHDELKGILKRVQCNHILLAVDACFSGSFGLQMKGKPDDPVFQQNQSCEEQCREQLKRKSMIYMASGMGQTPRKSEFARKWMEALMHRNSTGILNYFSLLGVLKEAQPAPFYDDFGKHEIGGSFIFVKKEGCTGLKNIPVDSDKNKALPVIDLVNINDAQNFITIPAGTITIDDQKNDIRPFHVSKYEVTVREFKAFVAATQYITDAEKSDGSYCYRGEENDPVKTRGINWRYDESGKLRSPTEDNYPVIHVSAIDARAYCQWLSQITKSSFSLPALAEWQFAAATTGGMEWAGTNSLQNLAEYANFSASEPNGRSPQLKSVGQLKPNSLGLFDMSGNVWEIIQDGGEFKACGGSWISDEEDLKISNPPMQITDNYRSYNLGFRVIYR